MIWRRGQGHTYRHPKYVSWITEAGWVVKSMRPKPEMIVGPFRVEITLIPPDRRGDMDNRIKVLLDFAQKMRLVENDRLCQGIGVLYGKGDIGARLVLTGLTFPLDA
jgi:Holliday junction resolvase RusA-like endonuclease